MKNGAHFGPGQQDRIDAQRHNLMMIIVLLYIGVEVGVGDVSDAGDFDVVFQYNGLEDGNGVSDVDVDDVGGDDVDDFEVDGVDVGDEFREEEVVRRHKGPSPKSLDSDENSKLEHMLFCREFRFVAIYALFWRSSGQKRAFLGQKQSLLGKKCT